MPRGAYTAKPDRKAEHIERSYEEREVSKKGSRSDAARKGWETQRRG